MKIVQVITGLYPGGAERVAAELSIGLRQRRHTVTVVSLQPLPERSAILDDLRDAKIPIQSLNVTKLRPWRALRLGRVLRDLEPDLVHAHLIHANLASRLVARRRAWRLVNTVHIAERRPGKGWHFLLDRWTFGRCDAQTVVSQAVRDFLAPRLRVPPDALPVVYNGIRPPRRLLPVEITCLRKEWEMADCTRVIGSVGRLDWQKGYDRLLDALPVLGAEVPEGERWGIVILGNGPQLAALEELAARCPDNLHVCLPGYRRDAAECIGAFDLFVMPSRYEGFGLTLVEAMAQGVPVLAAKVDSLPELLAGYPGGRVVDLERADEVELADAVATAAAQSPGTPVCKFTVAAMVEGYLKVYAECAK